MDKIKVGVIGIGFIGAAHIEALEELDAVHICTPNNLHYPQTKDVLAAGKHVLCEKPLAVTVKEARDLVKRADSSGLVTAVHFNIRFYPLMSHIRAMIAAGAGVFRRVPGRSRYRIPLDGSDRVPHRRAHRRGLCGSCDRVRNAKKTPAIGGDFFRKDARTGGL